MYYSDYDKNGLIKGHGNQIKPHGITVDGREVRFSGQMSTKTFDAINTSGLVLSSAQHGKLLCGSSEDAQAVKILLNRNETYPGKSIP